MYSPNKIPFQTRVVNILLSLFLLGYGGIGFYIDDIYIPGKGSPGTHYHGEPVWLLFASMLSASLNLLSVVADHYDVRDNEVNYKKFAKITQILGWFFYILALLLDLFVFKKGTRY